MGKERLASDTVKMQNISILPVHSECGRWIIWSLSTAIKHKYVYTSFYFRITNSNFEIMESNYDEKYFKGQKRQAQLFLNCRNNLGARNIRQFDGSRGVRYTTYVKAWNNYDSNSIKGNREK